MYIFKSPVGYFVMGDSKQSISKAGLFKILHDEASDTILILDNSIVQSPDWSKSISPTSLKKEDGTFYKNYKQLDSAMTGFFSDSPQTGTTIPSSYTPYIVPLLELDGRLAFAVGEEIDLTKDTIAIEGKFTHTPVLDYVVTNEAGIGTFTFTVAPTEQLVLRYIKK